MVWNCTGPDMSVFLLAFRDWYRNFHKLYISVHSLIKRPACYVFFNLRYDKITMLTYFLFSFRKWLKADLRYQTQIKRFFTFSFESKHQIQTMQIPRNSSDWYLDKCFARNSILFFAIVSLWFESLWYGIYMNDIIPCVKMFFFSPVNIYLYILFLKRNLLG